MRSRAKIPNAVLCPVLLGKLEEDMRFAYARTIFFPEWREALYIGNRETIDEKKP
jgi:hypothetical protein